jgi:hypothetical protein
MKYKAEYEKMVNRYSKLIGFIYGLISDARVDNLEKGDKYNEELQKIIKDN